MSIAQDVHFSNNSDYFLHNATSLRFELGDLFGPLFNWLFYDLPFAFKVNVEPERSMSQTVDCLVLSCVVSERQNIPTDIIEVVGDFR